MVAASREMAVYCFDALMSHFTGTPLPPPLFEPGHHPLFVTWKKQQKNGETTIRGCIGTLQPLSIMQGFKDYALISALQDKRFSPIQLKEVTNLQVTVSVLTKFEIASHYLDWEVGVHGIIVEFVDHQNVKRSATYLPNVVRDEGWSKTEAIQSAVKKSGYGGPTNEALKRGIRVTRYQSSLFSMHFEDYAAYCQQTRGQTLSAAVPTCSWFA